MLKGIWMNRLLRWPSVCIWSVRISRRIWPGWCEGVVCNGYESEVSSNMSTFFLLWSVSKLSCPFPNAPVKRESLRWRLYCSCDKPHTLIVLVNNAVIAESKKKPTCFLKQFVMNLDLCRVWGLIRGCYNAESIAIACGRNVSYCKDVWM